MKIVINISQEDYDWIKQQDTVNEVAYRGWVEIQNGTVLPKGHGELKDADALKEEINKKQVVGRFNMLNLIDSIPTIIEADEKDKE